MPPRKISFDGFIRHCSPLLKVPELEDRMRVRVHTVMSELLSFEAGGNAIENMRRFLRQHDDFLGVMLSLSGLSQEKFLRILTAERFADNDFGSEWGIKAIKRKIKKEDDFADKIASMFLQGRNHALLSNKIADFYLDQISLAGGWIDMIRNKNIMSSVVRKQLVGEYTDLKGEYIETAICDILDRADIAFEKGQVPLLGKEADLAIPSCADPYVIVMSSYQETTSSSQTQRANEQREIYRKLQGDNERYPSRPPRLMVNFVDGGGWLARRSDLRKMHASCDYCINMNMRGELLDIVKYRMVQL